MKKLLLFLALGATGLINAQLQVHTVAVTTNDLVYDSVTDRIYVSIPSSNGANGNSIGVINPNTYSLQQTVFMGSEPNQMAISDDGQFIYTGFSGSATVRRFNVGTLTAGLQFPLGSDSFSGPFYAYDLSVMPGNANAVAVSRIVQNSTGFYGTAIYDDGVVRPITTNSNWQFNDSYVINFKTASEMYAFNNHSTGFNLNKLAVTSTGVTEVSTTGSIVYNFEINNFVINGTSLYFDFGAIVDITSSPYNSGQFSGANGRVMYDAANNLVCFASYESNGSITFKRYSPNTFLVHDTKAITQASGTVKHIISCGNGRYAFNTSDNKVVIITNGILGVDEFKENTVSLYPNPTADIVYFKSEVELKEVKISDLNARVISNIAFAGNKINLAGLAAGVYVAQITDANGMRTVQKIVKK